MTISDYTGATPASGFAGRDAMEGTPWDFEGDETLIRTAEKNLRQTRHLGVQRVNLARQWALGHRTTMYAEQDLPKGHHSKLLGVGGIPVYEYAPAELAIALEMHPLAAQKLMADALDLPERLPHAWSAVQNLELEVWVARKILTLTKHLDPTAVHRLDAGIADVVGSLPTGRLLSLVEARVVEANIATEDEAAQAERQRHLLALSRSSRHGSRSLFARCDAADAKRFYDTCDQIAQLLAENSQDETLDQLRARALGILADPAGAAAFLAGGNPGRGSTVLYVHASLQQLTGADGVARIEDLGPATLAMLKKLLGHEHISLKPVIDLNDQISSDCYETPDAIAERLHLIKPADVYPYAESLSRKQDKDHSEAYQPNGPPGQTSLANLGHMIRRHHRIKTHAIGWEHDQLLGNRYLWQTEHGRYLITDPTGTHPVHRTPANPNSRLEIAYATLVADAA